MGNFIYFFKRLKAVSLGHGSILRTIRYNFNYLPWKCAIELPMLVGRNTKISGRGHIEISYPRKSNPHIYIGGKALQWMDEREATVIRVDGLLRINEEIYIGKGCRFEIGEEGVLELQKGTNFTGLSTVVCRNRITFGERDLISWNTLFMDSDAHTIVGADGKKNQSKSVTIDDHVWIGAKSTVLKGTYIGRDVVVAAGSIVHGKYKQTPCVIGGNPAVVIKNEITWDIGCPDR